VSRTPQDEQVLRVKRSLLVIAILTVGSLYSMDGNLFRPQGNPLIHAFALSWLVAMAVALATSAIFRVNPELFSLARWERDGEIYDGASVRAFRWVLLHSPLGWINPNLHLSAGHADCDRLLREMNTAEGVHWLTCVVSVLLAIWYLVDGYALYAYVMLLVRIPFDLYPIVVQRWNRGRVCRVLRRQRAVSALC
jgi:hypothetical protein